MSYEAMPCVLKNEDGTPVYGLLIKPLQNQFVIQLAPNNNGGDQQQEQTHQQQQQQHQQQQHQHQHQQQHQQHQNQNQNQSGQTSTFHQPPPIVSAVQFVSLPSQTVTTSGWNSGTRNFTSVSTSLSTCTTTNRRHYPTILPRGSTPVASKLQSAPTWASSSSLSFTAGNYTNLMNNGNTTSNGFAALLQPSSTKSITTSLNSPQSIKFAATGETVPPSIASVVSASTSSFSVFNNGDRPQQTASSSSSSFAQTMPSHGFLSSSSGNADCQGADQHYTNLFGHGDGGFVVNTGSTNVGVSTALDHNTINGNNGGGGGGNGNSSDLDSLLRDFDLNEITNTLMPLLQESGSDNGDPTAVATADGKDLNCAANGVPSHYAASSFGSISNATASCGEMDASATSRPPCRYLGLLSNTNNLRVGRSTNSNVNCAVQPIFGANNMASDLDSTVSAASSNVGKAVATSSHHVIAQPVTHQAGSNDCDRPSNDATTPDSGIQSIGDSPRAVPQTSPMQLFSSSPDARKGRASSSRSFGTNAGGCVADAGGGPRAPVDHRKEPTTLDRPAGEPVHYRSDNLRQNAASGVATSSTSWTSKFMQPLCVSTGFYEPLSDSEGSPSGVTAEHPLATSSRFAALDVPRCYSPSTTSSECGNESSHHRGNGGSSRRRKRTRKRTTGMPPGQSVAFPAGFQFEDMPVLQPVNKQGPAAWMQKLGIATNSANVNDLTHGQRPATSQKNNEEQLLLNLSDTDTLVEKILSVVPKEKLASLRQMLDERLSEQRNRSDYTGGGGGVVPANAGNVLPNAQTLVPRWQSTNAGYSSDTSDVSTFTDAGCLVSGKKTTEEEGDSAPPSVINWPAENGGSGFSPLSSLRRSSTSWCPTMMGDGKRQDTLKKLLEYREKARANCVKPSISGPLQEILPVLVRLTLNDGCETGATTTTTTTDSLAVAFAKVKEKLALLKAAPKVTRKKDAIECGETNELKATAAFCSVQNLETEASDDEEGDNGRQTRWEPSFKSSPERVTRRSEKQSIAVDDTSKTNQADEQPERMTPSLKSSPERMTRRSEKQSIAVDDTSKTNEADERPIKDRLPESMTTSHGAEDREDTSEDAVRVKENPQKQSISVKIKLSRVRTTTQSDRETDTRHCISYMVAESAPTADESNTSGKGKRPKSSPALPPKKRFKDKNSPAETSSREERTAERDLEPEMPPPKRETRKKRHSAVDADSSPPSSRGRSKKRKLDSESLTSNDVSVLLNSKEPVVNLEDCTLNPNDALGMRVFRRCHACKTWIRVEEENGVEPERAICAGCAGEKNCESISSSSVKDLDARQGQAAAEPKSPPAAAVAVRRGKRTSVSRKDPKQFSAPTSDCTNVTAPSKQMAKDQKTPPASKGKRSQEGNQKRQTSATATATSHKLDNIDDIVSQVSQVPKSPPVRRSKRSSASEEASQKRLADTMSERRPSELANDKETRAASENRPAVTGSKGKHSSAAEKGRAKSSIAATPTRNCAELGSSEGTGGSRATADNEPAAGRKAKGEKKRSAPATTSEKSANRIDKPISVLAWRCPRKTYLKAGLLHRTAGTTSYQDSSGAKLGFCVSQCRLLGSELEEQNFLLPYDIWWHHRYNKDFTCLDPSVNYRKLRSNVYVDVKPPAGSQHQICSCKAPSDKTSSRGCDDNCLNRMMYTECTSSSCPCGDQCTNNRFQRRLWASSLELFDSGTEKGKGIRATMSIKAGAFICEYIGELVSAKTFGERMGTWYKDCKHHYALKVDASTVIDSYRSGSIARFINHSCEPNCEMQKWLVNGHYRMGIFALRDIKTGEEISYNYKFHAFNKAQVCLCASALCRGFVDGSNNGNHQARKSKPKRSNIREAMPECTTPKNCSLKPPSHRERILVMKRRLFLLRNVDRSRKTLPFSEAGTSNEDEMRKIDIFLSQLMTLKAARRTRKRRLANRFEGEKSIDLIQLLKPVLQALMSAHGKDETPQVAYCKKTNSPLNNKRQNDSLDFATIERNLENGSYTTPDAFDKDVKLVLTRINSNSDLKTAAAELERLYESGKAEIAQQLTDRLGFQLPVDFVTVVQPSTSAVVSQNEQSNERRSSVTTGAENLYGGNCTFFVETGDDGSAGLWREKGDAFDKQDDKVHCVCGICEDDGMMIQCDRCRYWQHSECVGVAGEQVVDEYICEFCTGCNVSLCRDVVMSPQPEIRLPHCVYYRSLMKNNLQIRIGECVYVKKNIDERHKQLLRNFNRECVQDSAECDSATDDLESEMQEVEEVPETSSNEQCVYRRSDLRVFRVERLFSGPRGVRFVFGSYFARPHETFCEPSRRFYRNEIFVTPLYDTLPLDAVVGRCLVVDVQTYCKGRPKWPKYAEEDIYVCEYRLDKGQRLFDKMHVRNRYPICTKPYIFERFTDRLKIKRDFTPFNTVKKPDGSGQQSKAVTSTSRTSTPRLEQSSRKTKLNSRSDSGQKNAASNYCVAVVEDKRKRIEDIIETLKAN